VKAAVYHAQRDVRVEQIEEPAPGPGEVVLDVGLASICGTDVGEYLNGPRVIPIEFRHRNSGHHGPIAIGHEFFGRVSAVGPEVDGLALGDRVVSGAGVSCGECDWCRAGRTNLCQAYYTLGLHTHGGLAEQVKTPASICVPVPDACDDRSAALAQPLSIALHSTSRAGVAPGDDVVVVGVGGIGSFIVAAVAAAGAREILAVDVDPERLETARLLGATRTVLAQDLAAAEEDEGAAIVIEATGTASGLETAIAAVRRGGRILVVGMHHHPRTLDLMPLTLREVTITTTQAHICSVDLPAALRLLATTDIAEGVIGRVIPLDDIVPEGLLALAEGRVHGKVVIDVTGSAS
jgi:threonine dehydrogenase-like Zn-dependent dehydrogenase